MGFLDFLKSSNNIETDNGINEIYFDSGKSPQIKQRFILKNGKREGLVEDFHENGNISGKYEYVNDLQHGLTKSFSNDGSLFRESKFENNKRIGITKEFYTNGSIRFEYDTKKDEYTFFSKSGKKTLIAYIRISSSYVRFNYSAPFPEIYKNPVFSPVRGTSLGSPFGIWKVFNDNEEINYEIDFKFFSDISFGVETIQKNYLNSSGKIVSSELLDVCEFKPEFLSVNNISQRKDNLMDFDVRIDNLISFKKVELNNERLDFFLKDSEKEHIYAFTRRYCSDKFMFEFMIANGGLDSYKQITKDIDVEYKWEKPIEYKSINNLIRLDYIKDKYSINQEMYNGSNFRADQPYVVSIENLKIADNNIINENDLIDIGVVSHYEGKPFTGTAHILYEDGNIKMETQFKNGLKDGYQKVFFNSGQLSIEYLFIEDKLQKVVKRFLRDGTPMKKIDDFCISFLLKKMSGIDNDVNQNEIQFIENTLSSINFSNDDFIRIESQIKENNNVEDFVNSHLVCFSGENIISLFTLLLSVMVADGEIDRREKSLLFKIGSNFKMNENDIKELILKIDQQFDGKLLKNNNLEF